MTPEAHQFPWSEDFRKLSKWFVAYVLTLSAAWYFVATLGFENPVGLLLLFGSLIPYIVSLVFSYRVQRSLNEAKLYRGGAWQIIAGALLLNPFALGAWIPTSVMWATRGIERKIRDGKISYAPPAPPGPSPAVFAR